MSLRSSADSLDVIATRLSGLLTWLLVVLVHDLSDDLV